MADNENATNYYSVGGDYGTISAGTTLTIVGSTSPANKEPIRLKHVDARRTVELELENSPYQVKAWEDEEGVRWVQIGCKKATLQRWRDRGSRFIAVYAKDTKERARLAAGLKLALAAVQKAFA